MRSEKADPRGLVLGDLYKGFEKDIFREFPLGFELKRVLFYIISIFPLIRDALVLFYPIHP